jgi:hypothetical protein
VRLGGWLRSAALCQASFIANMQILFEIKLDFQN